MRVISTRTHEEWVPHGYQLRAIEHLCHNGSAAIWLDPGMGKTAVTLTAFQELQDQGIAKKMIVIAPSRVCQLVWRQEAQKWSHLREIRFAMLAGETAKERKALLRADADVWLINPESVKWLCEHYGVPIGRWPFDTLTIDESTKFKNSQADRSKALQPMADKTSRRWELTGTPSPNGYKDLFGQMKLIDGGAALGKYFTHFRDRYFEAGRDGFSYALRKGADAQIEAAIAPYVFRASADDYLELPEVTEQIIELKMSAADAKLYKQMKNDMIVQLDGATVTAANMAAVYNKLSQMAGGAIYTNTGSALTDVVKTGGKPYQHIHDLKLDALEDLVEELNGQPLLVAYAYGHERDRILERFPGTPYIGGGISEKQAQQTIDDWNAGKLPLLVCHPASAGHGLNMQLGNACHLCWFTMTWDYELYEQFIKRIVRQGNQAKRVLMYMLRVLNTMDELTYDAVASKETTQDALLAALKSEILGEPYMAIKRIGSPQAAPAAASAPAPQQTRAAAPPANGGWGGVAPEQNAPQKAAIANKIAAPPPAQDNGGWGDPEPAQNISTGAQDRVDPNDGRAGFSGAVQSQIEGGNGEGWGGPEAPPAATAEAPRTTRTRRARGAAAAPEQTLDQRKDAIDNSLEVLRAQGDSRFFSVAGQVTIDAASILATADGDSEAALEYIAAVVKLVRGD